MRKRAFKSPSEEYNRILDVVTKYAVHNPHAAWVCKKVSPATGSPAICSEGGASVVADWTGWNRFTRHFHSRRIGRQIQYLPPVHTLARRRTPRGQGDGAAARGQAGSEVQRMGQQRQCQLGEKRWLAAVHQQ
jgi:hypothetical protein